jgi:hypothetical protein
MDSITCQFPPPQVVDTAGGLLVIKVPRCMTDFALINMFWPNWWTMVCGSCLDGSLVPRVLFQGTVVWHTSTSSAPKFISSLLESFWWGGGPWCILWRGQCQIPIRELVAARLLP